MALTPYTRAYGNLPLTQITPFTYRDGLTFLQILNEFEKWLREVTPEIDGILTTYFDQYKADHEALKNDIDATKDQWQALFEAFIANIVVELEALNDQAVANLVNNANSLLRTALNGLYANKATQETVEKLAENYLGSNASRRSFTLTHIPSSGAIKEHNLIKISGGDKTPGSISKIVANGTTAPVRKSLLNHQKDGGGNIVINASGWWETDRLMGLQIKNGAIIQGWETHSGDLGTEALVVMKNGSLEIFDSTTSPAQIVSQGGWNSFSWGAAVYRNGSLTNFQNIERYSILTGRQLIGATKSGDIIIATFPGSTGNSGATGADIVTALAPHNFRCLYVLDGGGSTQTLVNGFYDTRSSDGVERTVPDALSISATLASPMPYRWRQLDTRAPGFSGGGINHLIEAHQVRVRVAVIPITSSTPTGALVTIATLPSYVPAPLYNATTLAYISSKQGGAYNARVTSAREIQVTIPAGSEGGSISFDLDYSTSQFFV